MIKHDYCDYQAPTCVSQKDIFTDKTAEKVLGDNKTWEAICKKPQEQVCKSH